MQDEWVVCRVFDKNAGSKKSPMHSGGMLRVNSFTDELLDSPNLPPLMDTAFINSGNADHNFHFKPLHVTATSTSLPSYSFPSTACGAIEDVDGWPYSSKNQHSMNDPSASSSYLQQIHGAVHDQNPYLSVFGDMGDYLDQVPQIMIQSSPPAIRRHCKVEQFSNQSMLSHDTGLSTDRNTEISSAVTKRDASYDEEFDAPSPAIAGDDLDFHSMWRF